MKKPSLFSELMAGVKDMESEREGKITLRTCSIERTVTPEVTAQKLFDLRERLHVSRAVFARYLRIIRAQWIGSGQGQTNAHAAMLIKLVEKYPETVDHLATI